LKSPSSKKRGLAAVALVVAVVKVSVPAQACQVALLLPASRALEAASLPPLVAASLLLVLSVLFEQASATRQQAARLAALSGLCWSFGFGFGMISSHHAVAVCAVHVDCIQKCGARRQ
jgi:hypothetical protein